MFHQATASVESDPEYWEEIQGFRPTVGAHLEFHAQDYRTQRWYVLHDRLSGRHTRINAAAYRFIARLDGSLSVAEIYEQLQVNEPINDENDDQLFVPALSKSEIVMLFMQLRHMGALVNGLGRGGDELTKEHETRRRSMRGKRWTSPLAIRIPLFDPDLLLNRMLLKLTPWLNRWVVGIWAIIILYATAAALTNAAVIAKEFSTSFTSPSFLLAMWLVYPLLKVVHEFAHALVLKRFGGEVHEMGITLLVLTPVPYVDASAAWNLRSRWSRALVSAAGIIAEISMAAIALIIWLSVEPGVLSTASFALLVVGSFSTLLFNANPLLKFDGYYVLQDIIEIPNLYSRAQRYYTYLIKRYILSIVDTKTSILVDSERPWFVIYGALSFIYRTLIMLTIGLWLIGKLMIVGVVLTLWVVTQQFVLPAYSAVRYLVSSEELNEYRLQRVAPIALVLVAATALIAWLPVAYSTRTEGVVWVPAQAELFASSAGQVVEVFVSPGEQVSSGDAVLRLLNPEIEAQVRILDAKLKGYRLQESAEQVTQSDQLSLTIEDIAVTTKKLEDYQNQLDSLVVRASSSGLFTMSSDTRLLGQYFAQGDLVGHVVNPSQLVIRVALPENQIGPLRAGVTKSRVRLAERFGEVIPGDLVHETPSANNHLPNAVLGSMGGGGIAIASEDKKGLQTLERVFHLEIALPDDIQVSGLGGRAYVNLTHPSKPLGERWMDATRQLFLRRLPGYTS